MSGTCVYVVLLFSAQYAAQALFISCMLSTGTQESLALELGPSTDIESHVRAKWLARLFLLLFAVALESL